MAAEEFVVKFHALPGTTTGEVKKSLNHLLTANANLDAATLNVVIQNLQPTTYMERLLELDFLIFFKRSEELLRLFKGSNTAILTKILKQDWFLLEAFPNLSSVQDVLLDLGYRTRMKFLNRLSRLAPFFDEVFDMVLTRYGIGVAREFVLGCSPDKVREVILNFTWCFNWKELKSMYKKDKSLVRFYFEAYTKEFKRKPERRTYWRLLRALAVEDFDEYLAVTKYFDMDGFRLGSRLTARITRGFRHNESENHIEHLFPKIHWRKSSVETRKRLLLKTQLERLHSLGSIELAHLLSVFPKKRRFEIWIEVLGEPSKNLICPKTLCLAPNAKERARLARIKLETDKSATCNLAYFKYLEIEEALFEYKELLNSASKVADRQLLLTEMVEACAIAKNLPALGHVIDYFCEHHRGFNLSYAVAVKIEQCFALSSFDAELWNKFGKLSQTTSPSVYLAWIEHLFKNSCGINENVAEFWTAYPNVCQLSACGEAKAEFIDASLAMDDLNVAQQITMWILVEDGVKCLYSTYPRLGSVFKCMVKKSEMFYKCRKYLLELVFDTGFEDRQAYLDIYFQQFCEYQGVNWFLNYEPANLSFERLVYWTIETKPRGSQKTAWKTWHLVKQYPNLASRVLVHCKDSMQEERYIRSRAISAFSMLATFEQFMEALNTLAPTGDQPLSDNPDEDMGRLYILRCEFGRCLQFFELSHEMIETLFKFCKGDYWQTTLEALISVVLRLPEKHLKAGFLAELKTRPVSVRKHVLYFSLQLNDIASAKQELAWFMINEKNVTIQKRIFESAGKFLRRNPYDEVFHTFLESLQMIRKEDEESLELIKRIEKIAKRYRLAYFLAAWDHLKHIFPESEKLFSIQQGLLHRTSWKCIEVIAALPYDFYVNLTRVYFLKNKISTTVMNKFLYLAVLNGHDRILGEIFNATKLAKDYSFFEHSYVKVTSNLPDLCIVEKYIRGFEQIFTETDDFREFAKVVLLKLKLKHLEASVQNWSALYLEFLDRSFEKFGDLILQPLAEVIGDIQKYFLVRSDWGMQFLECLLTARPGDVRVAMVVVKRIPALEYWMFDQIGLVRIFELLKLIEDPSVKINCNLYLMKVVKRFNLRFCFSKLMLS